MWLVKELNFNSMKFSLSPMSPMHHRWKNICATIAPTHHKKPISHGPRLRELLSTDKVICYRKQAWTFYKCQCCLH